MVDTADKGGLPRSRRADNDEDFPPAHGERHTIQHLLVAKPFLHVDRFDDSLVCLTWRDADRCENVRALFHSCRSTVLLWFLTCDPGHWTDSVLADLGLCLQNVALSHSEQIPTRSSGPGNRELPRYKARIREMLQT